VIGPWDPNLPSSVPDGAPPWFIVGKLYGLDFLSKPDGNFRTKRHFRDFDNIDGDIEYKPLQGHLT